MGPEGSLPCSQDPATASILESDEFSSDPHPISLTSITYALISIVVSSLQVFQLRFFMHFSSPMCAIYPTCQCS
jgi:hypothetical protein